jgi:branched-chain amino acid transport system substrate-binding protein
MKAKRELISIFIFCLILLPVSSELFAAPEKTLEIGVFEALTGFGSASEVPIWNGIQVYEEWLNKRGGITIKGQKYLITFVVEDTKGSADGSVAAANKLVYERKVKFIVGDVMPFTIAAQGTVTEPAKVIHAVQYNVCLPSEYGPNTPYTFLADLGTIGYLTGLLNYTAKAYPKQKTMVIIHPDDGAIPYVVPKVTKVANDLGLTILGDTISWPMDTVDFTPVIAKALARKPHMLMLPNGWPAAIGSMLKAAREAGFTGMVLSTNPADDVAKVAGPAASTNFFSVNTVIDSPLATPLIKEFTARIKEKFGYATHYNLWGLNSAYVTVKAIEAAQSLDPTVVRDSWEKMKTIDTIYGPGTMGGLKTYGINHSVVFPCGITSLMNNKQTQVKWVKVIVP